MKPKLTRILMGVAAMATLSAAPCSAQQQSPASVEFNAGMGFGDASTPHGSSRGLSLDALVGFHPGARRLASAMGGFVAGLGGSVNAIGVSEACDVVPGGSCTPEFPEFWIFSALAGWETASGRARFLIGPAVAKANSQTAGGAQVRLDLTQHVFNHVSLLASGQFNYIPNYRGDSFRLGSVGVGFRLR